MELLDIGDGRLRCPWPGTDPLYLRYHDEEWGVAITGDRCYFERLTLEAFQSGLSWITILRRREAFRRAFADFDIDAVAGFDERDLERLLADAGIIRNRAKITATVANARAIRALRDIDGEGALERRMAAHRPTEADLAAEGYRRPPRTLADLPTQTTASRALAGSLKAAGLVFLGPTTVYAGMQANGLVNDHLEGCWRRASCG